MGTIVKSILDAAAGVSTALTLVAFVTALLVILAIFWIVYSGRQKLQLLMALPEEARARHLPTVLRGLPLEPQALSEKSQTQITLIVLRHSFWIRLVLVVATVVFILSLVLLLTRPPPLPWQAAAYEIEEESVVWDLSRWKKVPLPRNRDGDEIASVQTSVQLVKVRADVEYFTARIGTTSPVDPLVSNASVPVRAAPARNTGVYNTRTWQLVFDISGAPVMEAFLLKYTVTYINAFQGESQEWAGFTTMHPTRRLRIVVLLPDAKPQKAVSLYAYPRNKENKLRRAEGPQHVSTVQGRIEWLIDYPRLNWNYFIEWSW